MDPPCGPKVKGDLLPLSSAKLSTRMRQSMFCPGATQSPNGLFQAPLRAPTGHAERGRVGTQLGSLSAQLPRGPVGAQAHAKKAPAPSSSTTTSAGQQETRVAPAGLTADIQMAALCRRPDSQSWT